VIVPNIWLISRKGKRDKNSPVGLRGGTREGQDEKASSLCICLRQLTKGGIWRKENAPRGSTKSPYKGTRGHRTADGNDVVVRKWGNHGVKKQPGPRGGYHPFGQSRKRRRFLKVGRERGPNKKKNKTAKTSLLLPEKGRLNSL